MNTPVYKEEDPYTKCIRSIRSGEPIIYIRYDSTKYTYSAVTIERLCQALTQYSGMVEFAEIDVGGQPLFSMAQLYRILKNHSRIESFKLGKRSLCGVYLNLLMDFLDQNDVRSLSFANCPMDENNVRQICDHLWRLFTLHTLKLDACGLTDVSLGTFADVLLRHTNIRHLSFNLNGFSSSAIHRFIQNIRVMKRLESISIQTDPSRPPPRSILLYRYSERGRLFMALCSVKRIPRVAMGSYLPRLPMELIRFLDLYVYGRVWDKERATLPIRCLF
jgi:hypothetical protein